MRHALTLTSVLFAASAISGAAMAQATNGDGLRYLSWPGKASPARAAVQPVREAAPAPSRVVAAATDSPIPLARLAAPAPSAAPVSRSNSLTPASAFYTPQPTPAPAHAPVETTSSTPQPYAAAPTPNLAPSPAPSRVPQPAPVHAHASAPVAAPPEPAPVETTADPMAPRRDAPIFRLQRQTAVEPAPAPEPTAEQASAKPQERAEAPAMTQAALAPVQGPRFYSVHRQAGRQPDAIAAPQPIYLDALPVELTQVPSSADLAQPDGPPALLRSSDGTVRAMPQTQADDLP